jgi:Cu(I)/Ag(I) efflux system membrane fusion protein
MIPRSAVHFTGERSLVFVRGADGVLNHREVTTGLVADGYIEVLAGLAEGDVVVSSANFLIDAEANMGSSMPGMEMGQDSTGGDAGGMPPMDDSIRDSDAGETPAMDHSGHGG